MTANIAVRLVVLTLLLAAPLGAQERTAPEPRPTVLVLATGGTISNAAGPRRTGEELVAGLPGIERHATVEVEQFSNVASSAITLEQWRQLSRRINELYRTRPELAGIVVTHGTDTMEETAYFLDLTVSDCRPVVVTGAMRNASYVAPDGPANLFNSIRLAASPDARRIGGVVLMNDGIFPAREATKVSTLRIDAFEAAGAGPIGVADSDRLVFYREPVSRRCGREAFGVGTDSLPRVDIVYVYQGADGALIRAAADAGAKGIVIATAGAGAMTSGMSAAVREVAQRGVIVVRSNRTGSGRVSIGSGGPGATSIGADDLIPQKARILLMLALTKTSELSEIRRYFEQY